MNRDNREEILDCSQSPYFFVGFSRPVRFYGTAAILVCKSDGDLGKVSKLPRGAAPLPSPREFRLFPDRARFYKQLHRTVPASRIPRKNRGTVNSLGNTESSCSAPLCGIPQQEEFPSIFDFSKENSARRFILVPVQTSMLRFLADQRIKTTRKATMQISEISPRQTTFFTSSFGNLICLYNWLAFFQFRSPCQDVTLRFKLMSFLGFVRIFFGQPTFSRWS